MEVIQPWEKETGIKNEIALNTICCISIPQISKQNIPFIAT